METTNIYILIDPENQLIILNGNINEKINKIMALIGISGKILSGKDTIGKILQILLNNPHLNNEGVLSFLKKDINSDSLYYKTWQIKKFADKLKDIVCMLLGCSREQLENREFKEKELGEEWWKYKVTYRTFDRLSYTPYGEWFTEFYSSEKEAELCTDGNIELDENSKTIELIKLTPRLLLQLLGTDCGRDIIHPNIWVNALMSEYKTEVIPNENYGSNITKPKNWVITKEEEDEYLLDNSHWVYKDEVNVISSNFIITDTRFENELKAVKDRGGITIRVQRPEYCPNCPMEDLTSQDCGDCAVYQHEIYPSLHESEKALDNAEFDYIIQNDGTIEELIDKVREIIIKENIYE